jgi:hypothetical protein
MSLWKNSKSYWHSLREFYPRKFFLPRYWRAGENWKTGRFANASAHIKKYDPNRISVPQPEHICGKKRWESERERC